MKIHRDFSFTCKMSAPSVSQSIPKWDLVIRVLPSACALQLTTYIKQPSQPNPVLYETISICQGKDEQMSLRLNAEDQVTYEIWRPVALTSFGCEDCSTYSAPDDQKACVDRQAQVKTIDPNTVERKILKSCRVDMPAEFRQAVPSDASDAAAGRLLVVTESFENCDVSSQRNVSGFNFRVKPNVDPTCRIQLYFMKPDGTPERSEISELAPGSFYSAISYGDAAQSEFPFGYQLKKPDGLVLANGEIKFGEVVNHDLDCNPKRSPNGGIVLPPPAPTSSTIVPMTPRPNEMPVPYRSFVSSTPTTPVTPISTPSVSLTSPRPNGNRVRPMRPPRKDPPSSAASNVFLWLLIIAVILVLVYVLAKWCRNNRNLWDYRPF